MEQMLTNGKTFDIVACLGVFYHTMHHYLILTQMTQFKPKLIIVDSTFTLAKRAIIDVGREKTESRLNSIAQSDDQHWVTIGRPSRSALELMAKSLGYSVQWQPWRVPEDMKQCVRQYFDDPKQKNLKRFTAFLRPITEDRTRTC